MPSPRFLNNSQGSIKSQNRRSYSNISYAELAGTTLVQSSSVVMCSRTHLTPCHKQFLVEPSGTGSSSNSEQFLKTSGLEGFRQKLFAEGVSPRAAELIRHARRPGTTSNYESSWKKWTSWCCEQQINPYSCHLNFVPDVLAYLFEKKFEYSTINTQYCYICISL